MKNIKYKKYSKKEMLNIIKNKPILFVETSLKEGYVIRKQDLADFIILETQRTGHHIEMEVYMPGIAKPVATTFGWFLNRINPILREEIIDRLVLLQTTNKKPKKVKIFNNDMLIFLRKMENEIQEGQVKNFDKFYSKYAK